MADIFSRMVSETLIIIGDPHQQKTLALWIGSVTPLLVFIAVVIVAVGYDCNIIRKDKKRNRNSNLCPSVAEWAKLLIKGCTLIGGILYFVGDNLKTTVNANTVALLSPALSISGVVILRIFTRALRTLQKYCKPKQRMPGVFNLCSPNRDMETHSLVVVYANLLTFLIEFDIVLSTVLQRVDTNSSENETDQIVVVLAFYIIMVVIFFITQSAIVIIFIKSAKKTNHQFTVRPTPCNTCCNTCYCYTWNIVLSIAVFLAVAFNLFAEIPQFYSPNRQSIKVRITLSSIAFAVCLVVLIGFLSRKKCGCVQ